MPHNLEPFWATMKMKGGYTAHMGAISSCFGHFVKETRIWFYGNVIYKMIDISVSINYMKCILTMSLSHARRAYLKTLF